MTLRDTVRSITILFILGVLVGLRADTIPVDPKPWGLWDFNIWADPSSIGPSGLEEIPVRWTFDNNTAAWNIYVKFCDPVFDQDWVREFKNEWTSLQSVDCDHPSQPGTEGNVLPSEHEKAMFLAVLPTNVRMPREDDIRWPIQWIAS